VRSACVKVCALVKRLQFTYLILLLRVCVCMYVFVSTIASKSKSVNQDLFYSPCLSNIPWPFEVCYPNKKILLNNKLKSVSDYTNYVLFITFSRQNKLVNIKMLPLLNA